MNNILKLGAFFFLIGFVFSCKPDGAKAKTTEAGEVAQAEGTTYTVDAATSKVLWEGTKIAGAHTGTINVSEGSLTFNNGKLKSGSFTMDMASLTNTDMEDEGKGKLEGHLKSADFFDIAAFPTAKFDITKATQLLNNETANYIINGNLTMKDVTKQVSFQAKVDNADGMINVSTPAFTINRTDWGVKYGSSSFFDDLKDKAINDNVGLQINLAAK